MANNVTIPATGTGSTTPVVETFDTTGSGGAQRQVVRVSHRTNPTSVLTRPANTTAYAPGQLIGSSTTAGSVTVPSFTASASVNAQSGIIKRLRVVANQTSGISGVPLFVDLWTAAPTVTNGDGAAYAIATGAANWLASFAFPPLVQGGDGAWAAAIPTTIYGSEVWFVCGASSTLLYWTLWTNAAFTPISAGTFTLTAELLQD